jgi:hypothetical protein
MALIDELYWYLKVGKPKQKLTVYQLRNDFNSYLKAPVFFLSTGRCGTQWFSTLLGKDKQLAVFHSPQPSLAVQGKLAWKIARENDFNLPDKDSELLAEIIMAAREQYFRYTAKGNKRYIETNNYITFFAPVLNILFPDAVYVHLVRNPMKFIRSGLDRHYYLEDNVSEIRRIEGDSSLGEERWNSLSRYGKIAWLWNETNLFIENFSKTVPAERFFFFPFDQPDFQNVRMLTDQLNISLSDHQIRTMLRQKKNVQKGRTSPPYDHWSDENKEEVRTIVSELATRYQFNIQ